MDAPNLERTASLTWSGIGGLNWDRTGVLPNVGDQQQQQHPHGRGRTASASVAIPSPSARYGVGVSGDDFPGGNGQSVTSVDALLADDIDLLSGPGILRRAVTFSGDFRHEDDDEDPLVAAPPGLGGRGTPLPAFPRQRATSDAEAFRHRATSDAAAVKVAWSARDTEFISSDNGISYSPGGNPRFLPRRSHSMSLEPTVWGSSGGIDSPRERSRTTHTLSIGSPETEVGEMFETEEGLFGTSSSVRRDSLLNPGASRLGQHYSSPIQQGLFPANGSGPLLASSQPARLSGLSQGTLGGQTSSLNPNQQQFTPQQRVPTPPFNNYAANMSASQQVGSPNGFKQAPAFPISGQTIASDSSHPSDSTLLEIQLQNLQAMQQQWMQMMQMQFDQTLYATQQRFQNMHVGGQFPAGGQLPFGPPKIGKYPAHHQTTVGNGMGTGPSGQVMYDGGGFGAQQSLMQGGVGTQNGARASPQNHRQNRRQDNSQASIAGGGGGSGHGPASAYPASNLLADHKISGRRLSAQELTGHVVEFARDSHGSRLVQYKMETGTLEERRSFVSEALPHALSLARDLFGNYVMQNFFDNAAQDQRDMLASALKGSVSSLCTHPHGCRVVQRALFVVSPHLRNDIIEELLEIKGGPRLTEAVVRSCSRDAHATHVLQKAVSALQRAVGLKSTFKDADISTEQEDPPGERERASKFLEIFETLVLADCIPLSMHQQACRLVQRVLGACDLSKSSVRVSRLLDEVFRNIDALAVHQNGNFVLQHIVEAAEPSFAAQVQAYVCNHAVKLARHKFGSHLVEKCLSCATPPQVQAIVEKFLSTVDASMLEGSRDDFETSAAEDSALGIQPSSLPVLMKDPYANFVVQKAFDVSRGEVRLKLSQEIRARTASLSKFSYGRHILTHINKAGAIGE